MLTASLRRNRQARSDNNIVLDHASSSINTTRGLPENTVYRDTGCDLASSCLECPLALCKYDDPNRERFDQNVMRDTEIMRLFAEGLKVSAIASIVNISSRTVYRVIQRELGAMHGEVGRRPKSVPRPRALRERVSVEQLDAWRQFSMPEMTEVKAA